MPTYLITFVAGDLVERGVGARTNIITEPSMIDAAVAELSTLENILSRVESYLVGYEWQ